MLRIPHCLDNQLTEGSKVASTTHQVLSTPQKHNFSASGIHFCQRLRKSQGLLRLEGLGKLKEIIHLIESRTHELPACSIVSQPLCDREAIIRLSPENFPHLMDTEASLLWSKDPATRQCPEPDEFTPDLHIGLFYGPL
jgi:hypothetical protein